MSEESEREAYELLVYERQCFEKQQEEAARRLARYDEAVRLLRMIYSMAVPWEPLTPGDIREVNAFLAAEPKEKL